MRASANGPCHRPATHASISRVKNGRGGRKLLASPVHTPPVACISARWQRISSVNAWRIGSVAPLVRLFQDCWPANHAHICRSSAPARRRGLLPLHGQTSLEHVQTGLRHLGALLRSAHAMGRRGWRWHAARIGHWNRSLCPGGHVPTAACQGRGCAFCAWPAWPRQHGWRCDKAGMRQCELRWWRLADPSPEGIRG